MSTENSNRSVSCLIPSAFDADAIQKAAAGCRERLGRRPDLALVFVSSDYRPHLKALIEHLLIDGQVSMIMGGSACGIFGVGQEWENASGLSFSFLSLPQTRLERMRCREEVTKSALLDQVPAGFLVFGNPLRCGSQGPLREINSAFPGTPAVGGMISGGPEEEDLFLFTEEGRAESDFLAIGFCGGIRLVPLVAQGCRPIGEPMIVTGSRSNVIHSIGGREPFAVLEETFGSLGESLRKGADGNIFAGLAVREEVEDFEAGDFVIRQIVGAELTGGKLSLAAVPRVGQTLQFQLRDAAIAKEVLEERCTEAKAAHGAPFSSFVCAGRGRGRNLFGEAHQNASILQATFGTVPITGFFGNGEFGPAAEVNFRHDHSLCGALFYSE